MLCIETIFRFTSISASSRPFVFRIRSVRRSEFCRAFVLLHSGKDLGKDSRSSKNISHSGTALLNGSIELMESMNFFRVASILTGHARPSFSVISCIAVITHCSYQHEWTRYRYRTISLDEVLGTAHKADASTDFPNPDEFFAKYLKPPSHNFEDAEPFHCSVTVSLSPILKRKCRTLVNLSIPISCLPNLSMKSTISGIETKGGRPNFSAVYS